MVRSETLTLTFEAQVLATALPDVTATAQVCNAARGWSAEQSWQEAEACVTVSPYIVYLPLMLCD